MGPFAVSLHMGRMRAGRQKWITMLRTSAIVFALFIGHILSAQSIRLALVADTHTNRGTKGEQPRYRARLDQVIASVNSSTISAVLIAGDLTESGKEEEYSDFLAQIKGFKPPVYCVPGNHDIGGKWTPASPNSVTTEALTRYEHALGETFYEKKCGDIRIIAVNSSIMGSGLSRSQEQWKFLETELHGNPQTTTVLFMHYPPFRDFAKEPGGGYWGLEPAPRAHFLELLGDANVKAVLSGHLHLPLVNHYRMIPVITSLPVSFGIPKGRQPQGWTLITFSESGELHAEFMNVAQ